LKESQKRLKVDQDKIAESKVELQKSNYQIKDYYD
jgi:hypothetical protein